MCGRVFFFALVERTGGRNGVKRIHIDEARRVIDSSRTESCLVWTRLEHRLI